MFTLTQGTLLTTELHLKEKGQMVLTSVHRTAELIFTIDNTLKDVSISIANYNAELFVDLLSSTIALEMLVYQLLETHLSVIYCAKCNTNVLL